MNFSGGGQEGGQYVAVGIAMKKPAHGPVQRRGKGVGLSVHTELLLRVQWRNAIYYRKFCRNADIS